MPTTDTLPKFLFCEPDPDHDLDDVQGYALHLHEPPFLARFHCNEDGLIEGNLVKWFTDQAAFIQQQLDAGIEPASTMARLMREAGDFIRECL
jgi:hypothetical protein